MLTPEQWNRLHRLTPPDTGILARAEHAIHEAFADFRVQLHAWLHPHPHDITRWHDDGGTPHPDHD